MTDSTAEELTPQQAQALAALLSGLKVDAVARRVKVDRTTVWRWTQEPAFAAEYAAGRRAAVAQATTMLQAQAAAAVDVLVSLMNDKQLSASIRLRAAQTVYEQSVKAIELDDVVQRLEALEAAHAARND